MAELLLNLKMNLHATCGWKLLSLMVQKSTHSRFFKPDGTMCRTVLLTTERNMNEYLHSIDETPKFVNSPTFGTTSIEHCVRRLVTYLARLQSVTQSSAKGLTLRVYVKLDTKEWLRMYSRLYHACELTSCMHLPDPVMLTAATLVRDSDDLAGDIEEERRNTAMRAIRSLRNELGLGGRPDAAPARSQTTMLAMDFDLMAQNKASRTTTILGESLRDKGLERASTNQSAIQWNRHLSRHSRNAVFDGPSGRKDE